MSYSLTGFWLYIVVFIQMKDILVVFSVMYFIGKPYVQLIPCISLSLIYITLVVWKRPFSHTLDNILNGVTEVCFLAIYVLLLWLKLTGVEKSNEDRKNSIGKVIIGLMAVIVLRCIFDLALGLVRIGRLLKNHFCSNRSGAGNRISPQAKLGDEPNIQAQNFR